MWKGPTLTQILLFCSRGPVLLSSVQLYPYCVSVGYRHAELHYELLWTRPFSRICLWGGGFTLKRMKSNCLGHILYRNYLLKHVIGGKIAGKGRRWRRLSSYWMPEIEGGSPVAHCLVNSLWKMIWICRETDKVMIVTENFPGKC